MDIARLLGVDFRLFNSTYLNDINRQRFIYNILAAMLIVLTVIGMFSILIYSTILGVKLIFGCGISLVFGYVFFNFYRLFILGILDGSESVYWQYFKNNEYLFEVKNLHGLSDDFFVNSNSDDYALWASEMHAQMLKSYDFSSASNRSVLSTFLKVCILIFFALFISKGIELFVYRNEVNVSLFELKRYLITINDKDTLGMIDGTYNGFFQYIHTGSILLALQALTQGFANGNTIYLFDFFFVFLFLIPIMLVLKSDEIRLGSYIKVLNLNHLRLSTLSYLNTRKRVVEIKSELEAIDV